MTKNLLLGLLLIPLLALAEGPKEGNQADEALAKLAWQKGPTTGNISTQATIKVPEGYGFLDERNSSRFLELNGNPPSEGNYVLAPASLDWFAVFSYEDSGYVKDDESIDAEALLKSLKEGDGPGNEARQRLGMTAVFTDGWAVPPHYDATSRRLEWGVRLRTQSGQQVVNYTARLLGRSGIMSATLVGDMESLAADTRQFSTALEQFSFRPGQTYAEFRQGDRIAEYGLAALVLGGAAAVAGKKGFLAALGGVLVAGWKLIVGVVLAALAGLRSLFRRKSAESKD